MHTIRLVFFFTLLVKCFSLSGQKDLKYFLDANKKFVDSTKATYYVIYKTNSDTLIKSGSVETYFMSGLLLKRVNYIYKTDGTKQENEVYYFENGTPGSKINTIDLPYEERLTYFPNGQLRRKAFYSSDLMVSEQCFTKTGKDTSCYARDDRKPEFPGGLPALNDYIKKNLKYPVTAKIKGISGVVQIAVIIDRQGKIESTSFQKNVDPLLDEEAMRVVKAMPTWIPGLFKDQLLPRYESLSVEFELPKK